MFLQQPTACAAPRQLLGKKKAGAMGPIMSSRLTASNILTLLDWYCNTHVTDGPNCVINIYFFSSASAKRMFHVCLGVSHERECFQEIAAGLSYKAVKIFPFGLRTRVEPRLRSRSIPKDWWMTENHSILTSDWSNWTGRSYLAPTSVRSASRCFPRRFFKCTQRVFFPRPHWSKTQKKSLSLAMALPYTSDY